MRRVLSAVLLAALALVRVDAVGGGLPFALTYTDSASDVATCTTVSQFGDGNTGTAILWAQWPSVANVARAEWGKVTAGTANILAFRRAADGTQVRLQVNGTTNMTADSASGFLRASVPMIVAVTWSFPTSAQWYASVAGGPFVASTTTVTAGSVTHNSTASPLYVGTYPGGTGDGTTKWAFVLAKQQMGLSELNAWRLQWKPRGSSVAAAYLLAANGRGPVFDQTGNANHCTITGAIPSNALFPVVRFRRAA